MSHPHEDLLRSAYAAFGQGDIPTVMATMAADIVWTVPGRTGFAGTYKGHDEVLGFFGKLMEAAEGTFTLEVLDVCANDSYVYAQVHETASRNGATLDQYGVHVWKMAGGKAVEFFGMSRDPYAEDEFFA
jgi:ketosteroid isomerase-like protein